MRRIRFEIDGFHIHADLLDTPTADAVWDALPVGAQVMTWGEEIYFTVEGLDLPREADARSVVDAGDIAYWPEGSAIAIGFGETPISAPGEIRLASPCNIWAKAVEDVRILVPVRSGADVQVTRLL